MVNAQQWLDINYPKKQRNTVKELNISERDLRESLDLSDFIALEELYCSENGLTSLNLDCCLKLKEIDCSDNQLTDLDLSNCNQLYDIDCSENGIKEIKFPYRTKQLKRLCMDSNDFDYRDLNFLSSLTNLELLSLAKNEFEGSLEPLKNMSKLEYLDISKTFINSGLEYLPDSVKDFCCYFGSEEGEAVQNQYENGCKEIYNLLADEKTLSIYTTINNFRQKLKDYKQKVAKEKARELLKDELQTQERRIQKLKIKLEGERKAAQDYPTTQLRVYRRDFFPTEFAEVEANKTAEEVKNLTLTDYFRFVCEKNKELTNATKEKDKEIENLKQQVSQLQSQSTVEEPQAQIQIPPK